MAMAVPQELVDGLGDESYQLREKAEQELAQWAKKNGEKGLDVLSDLKKKVQSPEVKSRLDNVISGTVIFKAIPGTRGYMGIVLMPELGAVGIVRVVPNSPAAKSGLQPNDKIIRLDGINLAKKNNGADEAMEFVKRYVKSKKSGEKLTLLIVRNGKKLSKTLKLADYDKERGTLNQRGNFNNGGIQLFPGQGGGIQRNLKIIPGPGNRNLNPQQRKENERQLLELNQQFQQQIEDLLEQQNERKNKRLEQLKKELELELKLKEKRDLEK
jgi:membrane-associated protease RseP (regulator of RpoE activity)|tara:strand:- start:1179 stop:1988 length:810 start_codon:yes stop_codon:yes gene_type:complete